MQNPIDYTIEDLEKLVAIAPYSQYHQMLLALKNNDPHKSALYQPYPGSLPRLKAALMGAVSNLAPYIKEEIKDQGKLAEETVIKEQIELKEEAIQKEIDYKAEKEKRIEKTDSKISEIEADPIEETAITSPTKEKPKKIKSKQKKEEKKKKKKGKQKKKIKQKRKMDPQYDPSALSGFSQWLLSGKSDATMESAPETKAKKKSSGKKLEKKKMKKKKISPLKLADSAQKKQSDVVSEPLAALLASQGHIEDAIEMYNRLIALFPEEEDKFKEEINKLKS